MNKADFLTGVASKADLSKKDAETALNAVLAQLSDAFSKGEDVASETQVLAKRFKYPNPKPSHLK